MKNAKKAFIFQSDLLYLVLAGFLLIIYFIIAWKLNYFVLTSFDYLVSSIFLLYFPLEQLSSMLWKILLLFPATLLFAIFLTLRGFRIRLENIIRKKYLLLVLGLMAFILIILTINFVLQKTEITDDELTYDLQAKILLKHKLYISPPVEKSFDNAFTLPGKKFTGKYTIGHPLILAAGMLLGSSYIFPVIVSTLLIFFIYSISMQLYRDKNLALFASFLLFISPFFYLTSSTRLSHSTTAFLLALFMLLYLKIKNEPRAKGINYVYSLVAGLAAGYAFNIRPLTALGFLFPFAILLLRDLVQKKKTRYMISLLMAFGFLIILLITLWYNKQITGKFLTYPFSVYESSQQLGTEAVPAGMRHTPARALFNLATSLVRMNSFLFGFPLSLIFVFLFLFKRLKEKEDKLCFSVIGSFCFAYLFYNSPGVSDSGPIYYYELIIPIILLSSRGILWLNEIIKQNFPKLKFFMTNFILISLVSSLITFNLERALHMINLTNAIREPYRAIEKANIHNAVVFIQSRPNQGFVYGFRNNSPDFNDDVLLCRLLKGETNLKIVDRFTNRNYYIIRYDKSAQKSELIKVTPEQLGLF